MYLDVHDDCDGDAAAPIDGKVKPVEEALLLQAVLEASAISVSGNLRVWRKARCHNRMYAAAASNIVDACKVAGVTLVLEECLRIRLIELVCAEGAHVGFDPLPQRKHTQVYFGLLTMRVWYHCIQL